MSLIFGIALPHFGLILADTRLSMTLKNGVNKTNDNRPLDLILPDGSKLSYGIKNRKFLQCKNGFAACGGHAIWGTSVLRKIAPSDLSKVPNIQATISSYYKEAKEKIASFIKESKDEIDRTSFLVINHLKSKACIHSLDSKGNKTPLNGNVYFYFPPDINSEACGEYNKKLMEGFVSPTNIDDILHNIKLIVGIQNEISVASQFVSSFAEIGLIIKGKDNKFTNKYLYWDTNQIDNFTKEYLVKSISNT
ncbi:hypothetical protein ACOHYD_13730 [Desulfobacterota bacterium M19]